MVFVTGGTGMLGAHLLVELVLNGYEVRALYRSEDRFRITKRIFSYYSETPEELFNKIDWVKGDLLDYESLANAMHDVDQVYHAAAMISFSSDRAEEMLYVNEEGTLNLVKIALENSCVKFCHISSISTLGYASDTAYITEESSRSSLSRTTPYGKSKIAAELVVSRAIAEGLNAIILNPSIILGPGDWLQNSMRIFTTVDDGIKFYTTGSSAYVDVRDVVDIAIRLMNSDASNERYIVSSENLSYKHLFTMVAESMRRKPPTIMLPKFAFVILQKLAYIKSLCFGGVPIVSSDMVNSAYSISLYSNEKIVKLLNYQFTPISETIGFVTTKYVSDKENQQ